MYGIIDIGSNTMRLNIYRYENNQLSLMLSKKTMAGLAGYIDNDGDMTTKGMAKAIACLSEFKEILANIKVKKTFVFATASLRNIKNSTEATTLISTGSGFDIQVLSGEEEARLDYVGASMKLDLNDGLLIDIGGGSTELVTYRNSQIESAISLPIGSLSLHNKFIKDFLPTPGEMRKIENKITHELAKKSEFLNPHQIKVICGVGGTVRATNRLKNELYEPSTEVNSIVVTDMDRIISHYFKQRHDFLAHLIKVIPDRLHTILPGMIVLNSIAKHFGSKVIHVSEYGVREGYLLEMIKHKEASNGN